MFINNHLSNFGRICCFFKESQDQWLLTIFDIRTIILNFCRCLYILVLLGGNIIGHSLMLFLKYFIRFLCYKANWYFYDAFVLFKDCFIVFIVQNYW